VSTVWFTPSVIGSYDVACSQLCGLAHFRMRARIVVESAEAFRQFVTSSH
jgi:cytochrome c oxidase subunit 2